MSTDASTASKHVAEVRQSWRATVQKATYLVNYDLRARDRFGDPPHTADLQEITLVQIWFFAPTGPLLGRRIGGTGAKIMRRTSWIFAVVMVAGCLFATGSNGPGGGYQHNGNMANAHLNWLSQQLELTEDQIAKLRPILMEEGQQMKAAREETALSPDQKQSKLKEIHKTFQPRINAVLTPEQQDKYKQLEQEAREKHEKKLKDRSGSVPKQ